jgi:uncharacterized protein YbjT (DUF2867 family)
MFVVLGASGHTGAVVATNLLSRGQPVRVVGRNPEHLQSLAQRGADVFAADATNAAALSNAFRGAEAAYVLIPPNVNTDDVLVFQDRVGDAIAAAIRAAGIRHVVALSSIGAEKASGTGPVIGLHKLEQKLNAIDGVNVLVLRAGYFMENTLPQVGVIHTTGNVVGPVHPARKLPMIATRDIGDAVADALVARQFRGKQTKELLGERDLDYTEATKIIGRAIGIPTLSYVQASDEQLRPVMQQMGMSSNFVELLLAMTKALNSGEMKALERRTPQNTTPTPYETFVNEEFVPAFRHQMAA